LKSLNIVHKICDGHENIDQLHTKSSSLSSTVPKQLIIRNSTSSKYCGGLYDSSGKLLHTRNFHIFSIYWLLECFEKEQNVPYPYAGIREHFIYTDIMPFKKNLDARLSRLTKKHIISSLQLTYFGNTPTNVS